MYIAQNQQPQYFVTMAWTCTAITAIWLACLALVFQGIGFAIPFWLNGATSTATSATTSEPVTLNFYVSIWYSMACISGKSSSCESKAISPRFSSSIEDSKFGGDTAENFVVAIDLVLGHFVVWSSLQIITTIAVGLTCVAVLILICCRCAGIHSKGFFILSGFFLLFGGLAAVVMAILVAIFIGYFFTFTTISIDGKTFPYSLVLFGIGGILGFIAAIFLFVITCKWNKYGKYYQSEEDILEDRVAMSKISKSRDSKVGYDRPRQRGYDQSGRDNFHEDRNYRYERHGSERNGYEKQISRDYARPEYENRGYERSYDKMSDRNYPEAVPYKYTSDNMYRPYRY